jgi:flagellin
MAAKTKASAIEKLSSGLRINSASDDAVGLAISEKMKGQIRGLEQDDRNIQDGISLVQTAEAGLGVIQDPNLLRIRKLVVQALDVTLSESDRANIQKELDNVNAGIDDIANNTEFNTIKVLSKPVSEVNENPPTQQQPNLDVVFMVDNSGSMTGNITTVKNGITDFVNSFKFNRYNR